MSRKNIVKEKQMIEIVYINKTISLKEKIIERIGIFKSRIKKVLE